MSTDQSQRIANLMGQLEQAQSDAARWRKDAEEARDGARRQAAAADRLAAALEPLWQRARTPGAESVPDDGTVTVFMKDCREALAAIASKPAGESMSLSECEEFADELMDAARLDIPSMATGNAVMRAYGLAIFQAQTGRPVLPSR